MAEAPWTCVTSPYPYVDGLPEFGWRVRLDHEFKEKIAPFSTPRLRQLSGFVGLGIRYIKFWLKKYSEKRKPFIDNFRLARFQPIYGVPIGGLGCGTIGRGYCGEFCRYQMVPGMYEHETVIANQFIVSIRRKDRTVYQQVLSPFRPKGAALSSWNWAYCGEHAYYHGLYPRSWTVYELPGQNVRLICRQISPVFPHDYQDTSLPAAVFVWTIENNSSEEAEISIMFTFKNGQGSDQDYKGKVTTSTFSNSGGSQPVSGVTIQQVFNDMKCTYAVGALKREGVDVSHCVHFDPDSSGKDVWMDLMNDGRLDTEQGEYTTSRKKEQVGVAVCCQCLVPPNNKKTVEFSLTWDMPLVHFRSKKRQYLRRYARWFGFKGDASPALCSHALNQYPVWEQKIEEWQNHILRSRNLPAWYKSALFNELYFVSDGGTVWLDPVEGKNGFPSQGDEEWPPLVKEYSRFAYLESHEYRMYNTYDVHHYASFALLLLWPKLQLSLQYDVARAIAVEDTEQIVYIHSGEKDLVKCKNAVPHDMGDPEDEPWIHLNAYQIYPTEDWKDLNTKFVLQVYRDYILTQDQDYLKTMYITVKNVMENCLRFDTNGDGVIENSGYADQTYDGWVVSGVSAYCGGIWLAALYAMVQMAKHSGEEEDEKFFAKILDKGKAAFEKKLWNGRYYDYDSSTHGYHDSIMADQLCGQWFLKASHTPDNAVFPKQNVESALKTIYDYNVMTFRNGTMGAINGMRPNGKPDISSIQSEEFWCGTTYGVAASMIQEGLIEEGWRTAYGVYHTMYEWWGLGFQTPEGYTLNKKYRSLGYMRPLAVWAIQHALQEFHPDLLV